MLFDVCGNGPAGPPRGFQTAPVKVPSGHMAGCMMGACTAQAGGASEAAMVTLM